MHVRREARLVDDHRCGVELSLAPAPKQSSQKNRPDAPYEGLPPNRWMPRTNAKCPRTVTPVLRTTLLHFRQESISRATGVRITDQGQEQVVRMPLARYRSGPHLSESLARSRHRPSALCEFKDIPLKRQTTLQAVVPPLNTLSVDRRNRFRPVHSRNGSSHEIHGRRMPHCPLRRLCAEERCRPGTISNEASHV